ncbi:MULTISPECIES: Shedu anti-phage system protein SduA domain-containing protein [Spirulina sp. CCY15215]|uniref:Shedu anti-phage system protein SduA domain-containing protein n=1 Tax=Spirulina sp. CCY15215 TaxID=2767591 RepID=UPI00195241E0|nr:Shedu anti-phage system protein SduA domain-containing protein [Spirulina major]
MKDFLQLKFNYSLFFKELKEFKNLLDSSRFLSEQDEILPFFRKRVQLSLAIGAYYPEILQPDRIAFEYDLFGDFACDLVIGDSKRQSYCFVEFENAVENSIFRKTKRNLSEWSPRFERGFSQIIDWFYKLDTQSETRDFEYRFGGRSIYSMGLLIIGRDADLSQKEKDRLEWRKRKILVNSHHIYCLTFDDLYRTLAVRRDIYEIFANSDRKSED